MKNSIRQNPPLFISRLLSSLLHRGPRITQTPPVNTGAESLPSHKDAVMPLEKVSLETSNVRLNGLGRPTAARDAGKVADSESTAKGLADAMAEKLAEDGGTPVVASIHGYLCPTCGTPLAGYTATVFKCACCKVAGRAEWWHVSALGNNKCVTETNLTEPAGSNPKDAIGDTKPDLSLIPPALLINVAVVMGLGAKKYGPFNWRNNRVQARVYIAAAMRHLAQYLDRADVDPESGCSHLAHAAACCGILLDAESLNCLIDNRPPAGAAEVLIKQYTKTKK